MSFRVILIVPVIYTPFKASLRATFVAFINPHLLNSGNLVTYDTLIINIDVLQFTKVSDGNRMYSIVYYPHLTSQFTPTYEALARYKAGCLGQLYSASTDPHLHFDLLMSPSIGGFRPNVQISCPVSRRADRKHNFDLHKKHIAHHLCLQTCHAGASIRLAFHGTHPYRGYSLPTLKRPLWMSSEPLSPAPTNQLNLPPVSQPADAFWAFVITSGSMGSIHVHTKSLH